MLEYFTYKKVKQHKAQKASREEAKRQAEAAHRNDAAQGSASQLVGGGDSLPPNVAGHEEAPHPVLEPEDKSFLAELVAKYDDPAPALPPRPSASELGWSSDNGSTASSTMESKKRPADLKKEEKAEKKPNRITLLFSRSKNEEGLKPIGVPPAEAEREKKDISRVLDRLNLSAKGNMVLASGTSDVFQRFTQVFKDLVNGVPTAYDDLRKLIEDRDGTLSKGFDKLPSSLKKLVTQLPDKITGSLAPELLAAAAGKQGIKTNSEGGIKGTAKRVFLPHNITKLVTKPGALVSMLRAIVEVLKTRWPAFIGMNVLWSVALTLLLFVLWYCHKRGREVRLELENAQAAVDGSSCIEELPDDPALPAPESTPSGALEPTPNSAAAPDRVVERKSNSPRPRQS